MQSRLPAIAHTTYHGELVLGKYQKHTRTHEIVQKYIIKIQKAADSRQLLLI